MTTNANCRFWFSVSPHLSLFLTLPPHFLSYDIRVNPRPSAGLLDRPWAIPRTSLLFNQRARSHGSGFHNRRRKETWLRQPSVLIYLYSYQKSYCIVGHKPPHWVKVEFGQTVDLIPLQGYPAVNNSTIIIYNLDIWTFEWKTSFWTVTVKL